MKWKVNGLSFVNWAICLAFAGLLGFQEVFGLCKVYGLSNGAGIGACIGVLLIAGLLALTARLLSQKLSSGFLEPSALWNVCEAVALLGIVAAGEVLRLQHLPEPGGGPLFQAAVVLHGQGLQLPGNGAQALYVGLLYLVNFLLGNQEYACLLVHVSLVCFAGLLCYLAVRCLLGRAAALSFGVFYFLSPFMVTATVNLNEFPVFLIFYSLALWAVGACCKKSDISLAAYVLAGVLMGLTVFLHPVGATLLLVMGSAWYVDRKPSTRACNKPISAMGIMAGSGVGAFLAFFLPGLIVSRTGFPAYLRNWWGMDMTKAFQGFADILPQSPSLWGCVLVIFLLTGCITFFMGKRESLGMLPLICAFLYAGTCYGTGACLVLKGPILIFLSAMAGAGFANPFFRKATEREDGRETGKPTGPEPGEASEAPLEEPAVEESPLVTLEEVMADRRHSDPDDAKAKQKNFIRSYVEARRREKAERLAESEKILQVLTGISSEPLRAAEPNAQRHRQEEEMRLASNDKKHGHGVHKMLENPLPVPPKHESNALEYDHEVAEDDDYDYDFDD